MKIILTLLFIFLFHPFKKRAICGEVLLQPAVSGRPVRPGRARGLQRERARGVHGAAHPHQSRHPERGDGEDLVQFGDQRAVGQVSRARHRDDHHQVRKVKLSLLLFIFLLGVYSPVYKMA